MNIYRQLLKGSIIPFPKVPMSLLSWLLFCTSFGILYSSCTINQVDAKLSRSVTRPQQKNIDQSGGVSPGQITVPSPGADHAGICLRGKLVAAETGVPVAGASLQAIMNDQASWEHSEVSGLIEPVIQGATISAKDGTFVLGIKEGTEGLPTVVIIRARGFANTQFGFNPEDNSLDSRCFLVRMGRSQVISGIVVEDNSDRPVQGIEVHAIGPGPNKAIDTEGIDDMDAVSSNQHLSTITDEHGRFRIENVDPKVPWQVTSSGGRKKLPLFWFKHPQGHRNDKKLFRHEKPILVQLKATTDLVIRLQREKLARLDLVLPIGQDSNGLVSVWTKWWRSKGRMLIGTNGRADCLVQPFPRHSTMMDVDNPRKLTYLRALILDKKGPRYRGEKAPVTSDLKPPVTPIQFQRLAKLTGQVVDSAGRPLPNIRISYQSKCLAWFGSFSWANCYTNQSGTFIINDLPGEQFNTLFSGKGYLDRQVLVIFPSTLQDKTLDPVRMERAIMVPGK